MPPFTTSEPRRNNPADRKRNKEQMVSRATQAELLEQRISENVASQEIDLTTWIFERIQVQPGFRVLELFCGTGGQTLSLLKLVGERGQAVALDISRAALDTLTSKATAQNRDQFTTVEAGLDNFLPGLSAASIKPGFDLIFCAYGLYYAADARNILQDARRWLKPKG